MSPRVRQRRRSLRQRAPSIPKAGSIGRCRRQSTQCAIRDSLLSRHPLARSCDLFFVKIEAKTRKLLKFFAGMEAGKIWIAPGVGPMHRAYADSAAQGIE